MSIACILEERGQLTPIEIKSSATIQSKMFEGLTYFSELSGSPSNQGVVIYGGNEEQKRSSGQVLPWISC